MPPAQSSSRGSRNNHRKESGSEHTYTEAYTAWGDFYQKMAEEGLDFFQRSVETAQGMMPGGVNPDAYQYWNEGFRDFMQYAAREGMPTDPQGFRELYNIWLESWSKGFEAYMRTPEFVSSSGKNLEALSDVQLRMGEVLEEYWHAIRLPSSRDMREIYHKLYLTERKQDEQDRKLDEINQKLDELLAMGHHNIKDTKVKDAAPSKTARKASSRSTGASKTRKPSKKPPQGK